MIDLSFLTEAEQEAILQVLQRDAELKKAEEDRIRNLQKVIDDENELKYRSGQWFYEAKSKRHRDKIHGADLVRASIRKRKKPATIAELGKSSKDKDKKNWVNSVNKDIFIPPELYGVMEDPEDELEDLRPTKVETNQSTKKVSFLPTDKENNPFKNGTASPIKQRKNPFNSANLSEADFENDKQRPNLENGTGPIREQQRTDNLSSKVKFGVKLPYPELNEDSQTLRAAVGSPKSVGQAPLPKPRKLLKNAQNAQTLDSPNVSLKREDSVNGTGKPRGILKRCSSSSSTDSDNLRLSYNNDASRLALPSSPIPEVGRESPVTAPDLAPENTADKLKQVRFSTNVLQKPPSPGLEPFSGREIGEFRILDLNLLQAEGDHAVPNQNISSVNTLNVQHSFPGLDNGASVSVSTQNNTLEAMDTRSPRTASLSSDLDEILEDSTSSTGGENQSHILEETAPEINLALQTNNSTDPEPIYAQVKKTPKTPSSDTSAEFDMEDANLAPRFIGQRGKIQNTGEVGQPLEFGKSYGGSGKTRNVVNPLGRTLEGPYALSNEEPENHKVSQAAFSGFQVVPMPETEQGSDASGSPRSLLEWKRPIILRGDEFWNPSSATIGSKVYESSQQENAKAQADFRLEDTKIAKPYQVDNTQSLGKELREETKYKPVSTKIVREGEEGKPPSLIKLSPERPQLSGNHSGKLNVNFLRDDQREMLPKSTHFKVMSLKDRIADASVGERPNPSQFQNLKSFWNVEGSPPSRGVEVSPRKTLNDVVLRSNPDKNLQHRNSREDSIDYLLPDSYDVLSEEEQTSHKVASWLAQTPALHENEQTDLSEQVGPSEEVVEEVQRSVSRQRLKDGEFSNALQKLREEASQTSKVPEMEECTSSKDLKTLPVEESQIPAFKEYKIERAIGSEKNINEAVLESSPLPSKTTNMAYHSENNRITDLAPVEIIEKQVVSNKMASEDFKIGLEKLLVEYESLSDDNEIYRKSTDKSELKESKPTKDIMFDNQINKSAKDQDEFAASLKKPDVMKPPSGPDSHVDEESSEESGESFDYHPEEEIAETTAPIKSSNAFKIGFEEFLDSEQRMHEAEEVVEKTIVTKNDKLEFASALNKLKIEASEPEDISMVEQNIEVKKQEKDAISTKEMPESIGIVGEKSTTLNGTDESESAKTQDPVMEATLVPVIEETVVKDEVQTRESSDFYKRLLQLQQEASDPLPQELDNQITSKSIEQNIKAEEPKDLADDGNIEISPFPNKQVFISKKVYSDIELKPSSSEIFEDGEKPKETSSDLSSPGEAKSEPSDKPKERSLLDIYLASNTRTRAKSSGSSTDQTGSNRRSLGNVIYKKPVTESPDVSKPNSVDTKQGKPVQVVIPHETDSDKPDKYTIEVMKAKDESISKVLDWFNRSSETINDETPAVVMAEGKSNNNDQPLNVHRDLIKEEKGENVDTVQVLSIPEKPPKSDLGQPLVDEPSQPIKSSSQGPGSNITGQKDILNRWLQTTAALESIPVIMKNPLNYQSTNVHAGQELEFGKSNSGLGKMKHEVDKFEGVAEPQGTRVLEIPAEKVKDSKVEYTPIDSTESKPVACATEFAGQIPVLRNQESGEEEVPATWRRPRILEKSDSLQPVSQEPKAPSNVQKRVSEFKLLSDVDRTAQSEMTKPVLRYGKGVVGPSENAVAEANKLTTQSSIDSDESLVTFKKVMLEDDEQPSHISQLKSFWEKNKAETTKDDSRTNELRNEVDKPTMMQSTKVDHLNVDKSCSTKESRKKIRKRHTLHNFFEKDLATEEAQKPSVRSFSVSESTSNKVDTLYKPSSFQSLRSFWDVGNNLKGDIAAQDERASSNTDRQSNTPDTTKSNKLFLVKDNGSTESLKEHGYDVQTVPQKEITPLKSDLKTEVTVSTQPKKLDNYEGKTNDSFSIQGVTETISKTIVVPKKDFPIRVQKLKEVSAEPPLSVDHKVEESSLATTRPSLLIESRPSGQTEMLEQVKSHPSQMMETPDQAGFQNVHDVMEFGTPTLNMESPTEKLQKASSMEMDHGGPCLTAKTTLSGKKEIKEVIEDPVIVQKPPSSLSSRLKNLYEEYSESKTRSDEGLPISGALSEVYVANESETPDLVAANNSPSNREGDHSVPLNNSIEIQTLSKKREPDESRTCCNEEDPLQNTSNAVKPVSEVVTKSSAPQKPAVDEFSIKLQQLSKEVCEEPSTASQTSENVHPQIEVIEPLPLQENIEEQQNGVQLHPQVVTEIVEKSFVPRRSDQFSAGLEKLANESKVSMPQDFETFVSGGQDYRTLENKIFSQGDLKENQSEVKLNPQESSKMIENSSFTRKSSVTDSPQSANRQDHVSHTDNTYSAEEVTEDEIVKTTAQPGTRYNDFEVGLQRLYKEFLSVAPVDKKGNDLKIPNKIKPDEESTDVLVLPSSGREGQNSMLPSDRAVPTFQPVIINVTAKKGGDSTSSQESQSLKTPGSFIVRHSLEVSKDVPQKTKIIELKLGHLVTSESPIHANTTSMGSVLEPVSTSDREIVIAQSNHDINATEADYSVSLPEKTKQEDDVQGRVAIPEKQNRKEIIEKIEQPVVIPRTRFNFATGLLKLYKETMDADPTRLETKEDISHVENTPDQVQNTNEEEVRASKQKTAFTENAKANYLTIPANQGTMSEKSPEYQGIEEDIMKSVAPIRQSYAGSLEKLQRGATDDEDMKCVGNLMLPNSNRLQSVSLEQEATPVEEYRISEDTPQERQRFGKGTINITLSQEERKKPELLYEDRLEPTSLTPVSSNVSVNESNSSLRRSTLELYLETPYRREISKSMDFELVGYVTTQAGNGRCSEDSNPILTALRRSEAKALSKPLVEVAPASPNQSQTDIPKEDLELGNPEETSFSESQFSNPEKLKRLSQSVPAFLHDETDDRETDSASESSFRIGRHKKSPSSLTNLSGSSGMASLSSVSGSVMSIYSGDFGSIDVKGNIQFAVDYVEQLKEFHVFVSQCKDLAIADVKKQRSDPYVKSYLLPDKAKMGKRKTAVKKKTLNPAYNEILRYKIEKNVLLNQRLNLSVWHNDALGRNSFLGEVDIDLATWDWTNKQMNWYPLQPRTPAAGIGLENRGEMKLALKYVPASVLPGARTSVSGEVHIWIKDCSQLPLLRGNKINSFVKCTILPDTSRKSRQKTRTVDKTPNPHFNHTMVYDGFKEEDLREACVELTVWDHNRLTNHFLGGLRIGLGTGKSYGTVVDWMDSSIEESTVWEKMMSSPDTWIEAVLPLRMLKVAKLVK